jgi:signal transduction histidine kinase
MCRDVSGSVTAIEAELDIVEYRLAPDDPVRTSLHVIRMAIHRIQKLAQRTIEFTPAYSRASERSTDVEGAVDKARQLVEPYLKARNVRFSFDRPVRPVRLPVPERQLSQVLVNLFQNAADAMEGSPERNLVVRVESASAVRIAVEDTGKGIRPSDIHRIFELFFTTKGAAGTGLGLYVARMIVETEMNGKLTAEAAGQKTRFTISIPATSL